MKKIIVLILLLSTFCLLFTSCGSGDVMNEIGKSEGFVDNDYEGGTTPDEVVPDEKEEDNRKIIKTYHLSLETKKFDQDSAFIVSKVKELGGYVSESSVSGNRLSYEDGGSRHARYTLRVPAKSLDAYIEAISEACNVYSSSLTTEDITDSYYGIQAQLDSLVLQEQKLNSMLAEAKNLQDMITIDDKLSSVRSQINALNYKLQNMDKSVNYSYVYINLSEVREYHKEETKYIQKLGDAIVDSAKNFVDFLGNFVIFFVWVLPYGIMIAAIAILVIFLEKRSRKKKSFKQQKEDKKE